MFGSILLILPTYNERENLEPLVSAIHSLGIPGLELLIVDDQSPDGTGNIADHLAEADSTVHVIHRKPPRGRGLAGIEGFLWARDHGYLFAMEMDADFSHPPEFIPSLLAPFEQPQLGIDLVIGSRYIPGGRIEGWPMWRHWNSAVANWMARKVLGLHAKDCTSGYRCFSHRALQAIPWEELTTTGPAIVEEILYHFERAGFSHFEVPITFIERREGHSKVTPMTILRWIRELVRIRRR
jgi:dolichol-phosphate mannosyltransferase